MELFIIAKYSFKEIVQSKVFYNVLFIGLALLILTYVSTSFTYGTPARVAIDLGLGLLWIATISLSIFIGVNLISNEVQSRTVYMILARGVKRWKFIVGKFLGLSFFLFLNLIILSLMMLSIFLVLGGVIDMVIIGSIFLTFLEALILLVVVLFFSIITNKYLSVFITLAILAVGHGIDSAKLTKFTEMNSELKFFLESITYIIPNFYKFNIKSFVLYQQTLSSVWLLKVSLYGFFYLFFLLTASCLLFEKKNLD